MAQTCTICRHRDRFEIDDLLVRGVPYRDIAGQFKKVSVSTLERHKAHIAKEIKQARQTEIRTHAAGLDQQLRELRETTWSIFDRTVASPEEKEKLSTDEAYVGFAAIQRLEKQFELEARMTGAFQKDRDNESDTERKAKGYEKLVERVLTEAVQREIPMTRAQAIERISAYDPAIHRYLTH